eukprot:scpid94726/ scgid19616/ 
MHGCVGWVAIDRSDIPVLQQTQAVNLATEECGEESFTAIGDVRSDNSLNKGTPCRLRREATGSLTIVLFPPICTVHATLSVHCEVSDLTPLLTTSYHLNCSMRMI